MEERILENAHIKRTEKIPVIAAGKKNQSELLDRAIPFTDNINWEILPEVLEQINWPYKTNRIHMGIRVLRGKDAEIFADFVINHPA